MKLIYRLILIEENEKHEADEEKVLIKCELKREERIINFGSSSLLVVLKQERISLIIHAIGNLWKVFFFSRSHQKVT